MHVGTGYQKSYHLQLFEFVFTSNHLNCRQIDNWTELTDAGDVIKCSTDFVREVMYFTSDILVNVLAG